MRIIDGALKIGAISVVSVLAVAGLMGGVAFLFMSGGTQGTAVPGMNGNQNVDNQPQMDSNDLSDGPWAGRNVKVDVELRNLSGDDVTSGTMYVYEDEPENWGNPRDIDRSHSEAKDTVSVSGSSTTLQYNPGVYYVEISSNGKYTKFAQVTIPDGNGQYADAESLSSYNSAPKTISYELTDKYSPSLSTMDLGVDSDTSTAQEFTADQTINPSDHTEYRLWKIQIYTGAVDPTTDSDSDGDHDEGIEAAYLEVSNAASQEDTIINLNNGVDNLGSDDKTAMEFEEPVSVTEDNTLTVEARVNTFSTGTGTAADGDETLQDGENPFDIQPFRVDQTGTGKIDITG